MSAPRRLSALVLAGLVWSAVGHAQRSSLDVSQPDPRFKVDLLLIVAHPDDDTLAGTYLAKMILDEGRRVAVVFATSGDSGGNQVGPERAASLGLIRQTEVRRDLATLGITNFWFLSGRDTAGQDPVRSLANWGHGTVLAEAVRIVRLTRPDVILTWLPMQVAGENHGDHQASAVIATEAFDMAGDPTAFPEQLAAPTQTFESLFEGLAPWQTKKLYFMSDAIDTQFMDGHGPSYSVTATSKNGSKYWEFAYAQLEAHRTQYRRELDQLAAANEATREQMLIHAPPGDALIDPLRFIRGKSLVGGTPAGDVFEGVSARPAAFTQTPGYHPETEPTITLAMGGPWHFYHQFWQAHGLEALAGIDLHEIGPVMSGAEVRIPLMVSNASTTDAQVSVTAALPEGWREGPRAATLTVPAGGRVQFNSSVAGAGPSAGGAVKITYQATSGSSSSSSLVVTLVVRPHANPLPQ
jgi:LmbE family N-acetylglucosaminyl deacetylase